MFSFVDQRKHKKERQVSVARDFSRAFYKSHQWLNTRKAYMETQLDTPFGIIPPYMCERCFEDGKLVPAKVVHHKIVLSPMNINNPEVTLAFKNLQRVCQDCHAKLHSGFEEPRVAFDENGNVIRR